MTEREILDRIVGSDHGLEDVTNAFSGFLYEPSPFEWRSSTELRGEIVSIDGVVLLDGFEIAHFARRLSFERGDAHARHIVFEVDGNFRRQGIAFASYEASLRFYDRVGIRWVHLDADAMGIFVWPSFGLDFDKRSQKEQMIALLRRSEVEPLPDPMGLVAPEVLSIVLEDDRDGSATKDSGARFLRELGRLIGEGGDPSE